MKQLIEGIFALEQTVQGRTPVMFGKTPYALDVDLFEVEALPACNDRDALDANKSILEQTLNKVPAGSYLSPSAVVARVFYNIGRNGYDRIVQEIMRGKPTAQIVCNNLLITNLNDQYGEKGKGYNALGERFKRILDYREQSGKTLTDDSYLFLVFPRINEHGTVTYARNFAIGELPKREIAHPRSFRKSVGWFMDSKRQDALEEKEDQERIEEFFSFLYGFQENEVFSRLGLGLKRSQLIREGHGPVYQILFSQPIEESRYSITLTSENYYEAMGLVMMPFLGGRKVKKESWVSNNKGVRKFTFF